MKKTIIRGVLLVLVTGLMTVVISCDMNGNGVSRSERIDGFISDLTNDRYDRLTRHMDPNIEGRNLWNANAWKSALDVDESGDSWVLQKVSNSIVNIQSGPSSFTGQLSFSYVQRGDDYYFSRITHTSGTGSVTEIAPDAL